ncbi:MAG: zinc-ribbon domain-containing protein [Ruminococcus sp.]|nr:zinc-ribbon domain-containing protein [Ruminococcus sp.]
MYYCKKCGAALTPEKRFCSQCGTPVEEITFATQPAAPQAETPAAASTTQPTAPQADTPAAAPTTQPTAPQAETPAAAPTTQPTTSQAEAPAAVSTTQPTAPQAETPAAASTTQPTAPQQAAAPQNGTPVSPQSSATTQQQAAWQNPQQQAQPTPNAGQPTGQQPQMSWQDWQNFQNWQNAQQQGQKSANNMNLSNGVQKLEESDSFMFRSLGLTLKTLMKKPVQLWGLSLLGVILQSLSNLLCAVPPILGMGVSSTLSAGMENVFLDAYHQKEINSKQIFSGFSSGKSFLRIAGGMLWRTLWLFLWTLFALIPIVGWVIAPIMLVIKGISYSFTPYLLLRKKDISPLDALKRSMEMTKGYRAKIFLTYLICYAALLVIGLLLFLIAQIPVIGFIIVGIVGVVISVLCPLFFGVLRAAMFTEVVRLEKITDIEL